MIEKNINAQFEKWVKSISDKDVRQAVMNKSIITGGCITSMLLGEPVNDYDIYFMDKETTRMVAEYYVNKYNIEVGKDRTAHVIDGDISVQEQLEGVCDLENEAKDFMEENIDRSRIKIFIRSAGVSDEIPDDNYSLNEFIKSKGESTENGKFKPVFLSSNAITLTDKMQIIIRFHGSPEDIHENFDFVHCTNYWRSDNRKLYTNKEALESTLSKNLYYCGSKYPLCSIIRTRKFIKRGWHINAGQYLKMAFQLNELDLNDINVLQDQLIGVDVYYFNALLADLKSKRRQDPNFPLGSDYVISLIDKIF